MRRTIAAILAVLGFIRLWFDWQSSIGVGERFQMQPIGKIWFEYDRASQLSVSPALERYGFEWLYDPFILTFLQWPLVLVLFGSALFFWLMRRRRPRKPSMFRR